MTDTARYLKIQLFDRIKILLLTVVMLLTLTGCENSQIYLTTGFKANEVFIMDDVRCTLPEVMVYILSIQNRYESVYGDEIWNTSVQNVTMPDNVKENVLAEISQIKAMNILAKQNNTTLSEEEEELAKEAANDYYASMSNATAEEIGIDVPTLVQMYREYALANKLYKDFIKDINPEISDDEARTITVQHIFVKTYTTDGTGKKLDYSEGAKKIAYDRAQMLHSYALDGEHDFENLVMQYSDGETGDYSFCKGDTEPEFEEAAFNLGKDEISDVIMTKYGYHIIKCITTFNREETDLNKIKLAEEAKEQVFSENFDDFAQTLTTHFNHDLWDKLTVVNNTDENAQDFFEVYHKFFN